MKKNVGTFDSMIRITLGLFGLAWAASQMVKRPRRKMPIFIAFQSSLKVAEGVTRFCPGLALLGINTLDEENQEPKISDVSMKKPPLSAQQTTERGVYYE